MKLQVLFLLLINVLIGCESDDKPVDVKMLNADNSVLMLKVDYLTSKFEGGKEFNFSRQSDDFTIANEYKQPGDFGSVKLIYEEINEVLFYGTIHWMGLGEMTFPATLRPAKQFEVVLTEDYIYPDKGFEDVFDPHKQQGEDFDYGEIWASVQNLVKVRGYLGSDPDQTVKIFLYTPSVGMGNPADWDWIIYLKKNKVVTP